MNNEMNGQYKVETHAHTAEVSRCGYLDGEELARLYAESGYSTLFITDHFYSPFFTALGDMDWPAKLRAYKKGYEAAKAAGERYGLRVLFGVELRLDICENDYLLYGLPNSFYEGHPEIFGLDVPSLLALVRQNGGLMIQAHPTRAPKSSPTPEYVDGFEVHNTNPRHADNTDFDLGNTLADRHGLLRTGGSDAHRREDVARGGMVFTKPIETPEDFVRAVRERRGCIL